MEPSLCIADLIPKCEGTLLYPTCRYNNEQAPAKPTNTSAHGEGTSAHGEGTSAHGEGTSAHGEGTSGN